MKFSLLSQKYIPDPCQQVSDHSDIIPANNVSRTLVLCFDSTGGAFGPENSNVVQFVSLLAKGSQTEQMVYYHTGIGTSASSIGPMTSPFKGKLLKSLDMATAWHLKVHILDGYSFLMENYTTGDKICLFGFSRGAYTARALAGMLNKVGLLSAGNHQQVPFAYQMYTDNNTAGWAQSISFKKTFCRIVDVDFVGVWDTVSSLGLFAPKLPLCSSIRVFRHAISLDEHRVAFRVSCFATPDSELGSLPYRRNTITAQEESEKPEYSSTSPETDCLEVWFAGCHTDVGGGGVPSGTQHSLSRIPLRWMVRQCFLANTGIRFHSGRLRDAGLNPDTLYPHAVDCQPYFSSSLTHPTVISSQLSDEQAYTIGGYKIQHTSPFSRELKEDVLDASQPIHDALVRAPLWRILELLPRPFITRVNFFPILRFRSAHRGRARKVPAQTITYFHRTVDLKMKMTSRQSKPYRPRAIINQTPVFVE